MLTAPPPSRSASKSTPAATTAQVGPGRSWLSLLASSSLGVEQVATTTTEVRVENGKLAKGPMRLVVQSFEPGSSGPNARPISSAQRSVTAAELRRGVKISLVDLSAPARDARRGAQVVAWVEPGEADLEYDGRKARPGADSLVGVGRPSQGAVTIVLQGRAA